MVRIIIALAALGLCSCAQMEAERQAADDAHCRGYGAKPGTDVYANCRLALDLERINADAARRSAFLAAGSAILSNQQAQQAAMPPPPPIQYPTRCRSTGDGYAINTTCY